MNEAEYIAAETERLLRGAVRLCACGCGKPTNIAQRTNRKMGFIKGRPFAFLRGHKRFSKSDRLSKMFRAEFQIYQAARNRCRNPRSSYAAFGIKFLFTSFDQFFLYLGPRPSPNHSLERDDNNGNYEPSNCYWATREVQDRNKRMNNQHCVGRPMQDELEPLY